MGKMKKKGESGAVTNFISRNQALKKLQLSLPDFRRLCILKGIYPREPKNKKKVNKGSTAFKTYYFTKDIQFLAHDPIISKFREMKIFLRKLKRAYGKDELSDAERLEKSKPTYSLDHIVKERYPTFVDALRDLDDALSLMFLFSQLPQTDKIKFDVVKKCKTLCAEFQNFVIASRCLKKVFVSIKGFYYQAELQGQTVTWIVPHQFTQQLPEDVDFRIMLTFIEFYTTMLGFINYQLYHTLNLHYPPELNSSNEKSKEFCQEDDVNDERLASLTSTLKSIYAEDTSIALDEFPSDSDNAKDIQELQKQDKALQTLFEGHKFYLSREVPRNSLVFTIRCFGGEVSWDRTVAFGSTYDENDSSITHQIVDRKAIPNAKIDRKYVQPQWIFDCVNCRKILPTNEYVPGALLPPHLSPFVEAHEEEGVSLSNENEEESTDVSKEAPGSKRKLNEDTMTEEEKKLALMMLPKKKKVLYDKIIHSKKKKAAKVKKLKEKRQKLQES